MSIPYPPTVSGHAAAQKEFNELALLACGQEVSADNSMKLIRPLFGDTYFIQDFVWDSHDKSLGFLKQKDIKKAVAAMGEAILHHKKALSAYFRKSVENADKEIGGLDYDKDLVERCRKVVHLANSHCQKESHIFLDMKKCSVMFYNIREAFASAKTEHEKRLQNKADAIAEERAKEAERQRQQSEEASKKAEEERRQIACELKRAQDLRKEQEHELTVSNARGMSMQVAHLRRRK